MMREHFIVDNSTTPDWEVMPLGPVDKEGRKVSLSTATLFADSGMECTVRRYEYLLGAGVWRACCDEGVVSAALEHGKFVFVEVKSCMADFKSGHGLTFLGDENWLVCTRDLAHELYDECLLPFGVQVYCPDNGGALRLTYDLRMQAAKSLREDSTLCLLWAMLMDSYSRWRTTWDVFNETGESCDL